MDKRADKALESLSIEEKIKFLSGVDFWHLHSAEEIAIGRTMVSDGPHGLRKQDDAQDNLGINDSISATCFPTAVGIAASFDKSMIHRLGMTLGKECRAEDVSILLGPGVNIKRSPLCGRNFEYFSEDPYLTGVMASNYVQGVQSQGVGVSVKHFACNNQETRRYSVSATVDERALREIYLAAFERIVKEAKPWTLMCSYNKINGVYASQNDKLLNKILRDEWGFDGYVMSDWGAVIDRDKGLSAGLDLEMPSSYGMNGAKILSAYRNGEVSEKEIDTACGRILDKIYLYQDNKSKAKAIEYNRAADHKLAKEFARDSMVLLKNEDNILPITKGQKIAFIGEFAAKPRYQGGGSSHINTKGVVSVCDVIKDIPNASYARGYDLATERSYADDLLVEAIMLAGESDAVVAFVGLPDSIESEGYDRTHMDIPYNQFQLIKELRKVQQNIIVVLCNGAPIVMPWLDDVKAVLEGYLGGEAIGEAIIDILYGEHNPSAKLAETFPLDIFDAPTYNTFPGSRLSAEYRESIFVGYRYYDAVDKDVLFPFGYGLSYTEYEYSNLHINAQKIGENQGVDIELTIKNIGKMRGKEVCQVYVAPPKQCSVFMAPKQLFGFDKISLEPGEAKTVKISIEPRAFKYFNTTINNWATIGGEFNILVGASSRDIRLSAIVQVEGSQVLPPYSAERLPTYYSGDVRNVSEEEWQILYGMPLPPRNYPTKGRIYSLYDTLEDVQGTFFGKIITKLLMKNAPSSDELGEDMFAATVKQLPFINFCAMSFGIVNESTVGNLVNLFNARKVVRSIYRICRELWRNRARIKAAVAPSKSEDNQPNKGD